MLCNLKGTTGSVIIVDLNLTDVYVYSFMALRVFRDGRQFPAPSSPGNVVTGSEHALHPCADAGGHRRHGSQVG